VKVSTKQELVDEIRQMVEEVKAQVGLLLITHCDFVLIVCCNVGPGCSPGTGRGAGDGGVGALRCIGCAMRFYRQCNATLIVRCPAGAPVQGLAAAVVLVMGAWSVLGAVRLRLKPLLV
jgi:hypothetical protein